MPSSPVRPVLAVAAALALVLALSLGLGAATAQAAFFVEARDPVGDATSPDPAHDLVAVGFGYERRTGQLAGVIRLRGAPTEAPADVTLIGATRRGSECTGAAVALSARTDEFGAGWFRFASPTEVSAHGEGEKRGYRSAVQEYHATDRRLAGLRPDCVVVALTEPGNAENVYDTVGPVRLTPLPSLALRLRGLPEEVRSGRAHTLKVTVSNPGDAPTARVRVRLGTVRGVSARPRATTLPRIPAGRRRTATLTVRFGARAATSTDLRVSVRAGRLSLSETLEVFVRKPQARRGGGGGAGGGVPSVCTQWFPDFSGDTGGSLGLVPCLR